MEKAKKKTQICEICQKEFPEDLIVSGYGIRKEVEKLIQQEHPHWSDASYICQRDLNRYRRSYVLNLVNEERGKIEQLTQEVINSIEKRDILTENPSAIEEKLSIGDKISDKMARFGGSWAFIISFVGILVVWIAFNTIVAAQKIFDPYPFILLNLILSCIAAIQAPIIMMSQNRQEQKDRLRSENEYQINLKAEIEIRMLHEKMDHLLMDQWVRLMKTQEIQLDMLEEIRKEVD